MGGWLEGVYSDSSDFIEIDSIEIDNLQLIQMSLRERLYISCAIQIMVCLIETLETLIVQVSILSK